MQNKWKLWNINIENVKYKNEIEKSNFERENKQMRK
jgi:hypothetical protein